MVPKKKLFVEDENLPGIIYLIVKKLLKQYPKKCGKCGKKLTANEVIRSYGFLCLKCWLARD